MFQSIKSKINQKKVLNKLEEFHDIEVYRYQVECRMVDGSVMLVGDNYAYTKCIPNEWMKSLLRDDSIHTNTNTYIKSKNIIECKLVDTNVLNTKYRYEDYYDSYRVYFTTEEIDKSKKRV